MTEQWQELKETIIEMRDNDGTLIQQEVCKFLANYMDILEKQMQEPCEDCISRAKALDTLKTSFLGMSFERYKKAKRMFEQLPPVTPRRDLALTSQDCIRRQAVIILIDEASEMHPYKVVGDSDTYSNYNQGWSDACDWLYANIEGVPSVTPQYTDEEIDKAQAVEQAYVDKMVELAVEETRREWLNSFDTSSATKCFEAVNILKERVEHEESKEAD